MIQLPADATIEDIRQAVDGQGCNDSFKPTEMMLGNRCVVAARKWAGGKVARSTYLHIYHIDSFEKRNIITHWREQKNGNFKTV